MTELRGYIIARHELDDNLALQVGYFSLGLTRREAWLRFIGNTRLDETVAINRMAQKGYSPRTVVLRVGPSFKREMEMTETLLSE